MSSSVQTKLQQMPPWARVWLSALLLLGVLSMHSAIVSDEGGLIDHHGTIAVVQSSVSAVVAAGVSVTHLDDVPGPAPLQDGEPGLSMSDCGGVAMVCLAMIVGVSAYIVLRGRGLDRIFWQVPSTVGTTFGRPSRPFEARSPRERSSVLRR